jgi:hypothetical protein
MNGKLASIGISGPPDTGKEIQAGSSGDLRQLALR